jgi:hypothetical protein
VVGGARQRSGTWEWAIGRSGARGGRPVTAHDARRGRLRRPPSSESAVDTDGSGSLSSLLDDSYRGVPTRDDGSREWRPRRTARGCRWCQRSSYPQRRGHTTHTWRLLRGGVRPRRVGAAAAPTVLCMNTSHHILASVMGTQGWWAPASSAVAPGAGGVAAVVSCGRASSAVMAGDASEVAEFLLPLSSLCSVSLVSTENRTVEPTSNFVGSFSCDKPIGFQILETEVSTNRRNRTEVSVKTERPV